MKKIWFSVGFLTFIFFANVQIHAQQADSDQKVFQKIKAKAESGDAASQFDLGDRYIQGQGVEKNVAEGLKWWRKAAEQGFADAQFQLGGRYMLGIGVEKNVDEAIKWIKRAADQGHVEANLSLSLNYYNNRNYAEAIKIWRILAEKDNPKAEDGLGGCYATGCGVEKDVNEAIKWFRKSASQGSAAGQLELGSAYLNGSGVVKDYVEAYKWLNLASAQGMVWARENLPVIERNMTPEQIAEGQRRAASFKPRKQGDLDSNLDSQFTTTGTGFFITDDGYLISNYHIVKGAAKFRLLTGAGLIDATVVKVDAANDLALLKATGKFSPLPIAASRTVKLGATVATVGFPDTGLQGFSPKLAKGEIGSLAGIQDDPRYFQISVPVQPGNSGGALVDARGNVVGIVAAKLSAKAALDATGALPENVNYAVKSSLLLSFLESVPDVAAKLKDPNTKDEAFEDVVKSAQDAAVLVLVY